jgi:hypothetical protein
MTLALLATSATAAYAVDLFRQRRRDVQFQRRLRFATARYFAT